MRIRITRENLPIKAQAFILLVVIAGFASLSVALPSIQWNRWWLELALISILCAATASFKVRLPVDLSKNDQGTVSVAYTFVITALMLMGWREALLVGSVSGLAASLLPLNRLKQMQLFRVAFNSATAILTACLASLVYVNLKEYSSVLGFRSSVFALILATTAYFLVNSFLVAMAIAFCNRKPVDKIWKENCLWTAPGFYVGSLIALIITTFIQQIGVSILFLVIPPVYLTFHSYRLYIGRIQDSTRHLNEMAALHLRTIEALALAIDAKDQTTHLHLQRVRIFATGLAKALNLSEPEIQALQTGALLHDVGKLAVPEYILNKPGKLTPQEFQKMKIHPQVGAEILSAVKFPYPVVPVVLCHHERWDGTGYPNGLKGEEIPITARILSIVDCFDALASDRPYRKALPTEEALKYLIEQRDKAFDPKIVDLFTKLHPALEHEAWEAAEEAKRVSQTDRPSPFVVNPVADANARPAAGFSEPVKMHVLRNIAAMNQEVFSLYELIQSVGTSLNLTETLALIAGKIRKIIDCDTVVCYLLQEDRLRAHFVEGSEREQFGDLAIPLGEGVTGWVAENKRPLVNANPAVEFGYLGDSQRFTCMRSALIVPLQVGEEMVGVLSLYDEEPNKFTIDNLRVLELIASKTAIAVKNAMTFEQTYEYSLTDVLTGLPNSRHLFLKLDEEIARARRTQNALTVLAMDLDNFKEVNDTCGHAMGDKTLRQVAAMIRSTLREYDFLARLGGDEFIALLPGLQPEDVENKIAMIQKEVANIQSEWHLGHSIKTSVSVGSAQFPLDGKDAETLLSVADARMYKNKFGPKAPSSPEPTATTRTHLEREQKDTRVAVQ